MTDKVNFHFNIDGDNFTSAGEASVRIKKHLRELGFKPDVIRRVSVAMYEGEINMVIHANGGVIDVEITENDLNAIIMRYPADKRGMFNSEMGKKQLLEQMISFDFRISKNHIYKIPYCPNLHKV